MSLGQDFESFINGNSPIPYYFDGAKYVCAPDTKYISDYFEYQFLHYYKCFNQYYCGISSSPFVLKIHASDYKLMKSMVNLTNESERETKKQLSFLFL